MGCAETPGLIRDKPPGPVNGMLLAMVTIQFR